MVHQRRWGAGLEGQGKRRSLLRRRLILPKREAGQTRLRLVKVLLKLCLRMLLLLLLEKKLQQVRVLRREPFVLVCAPRRARGLRLHPLGDRLLLRLHSVYRSHQLLLVDRGAGAGCRGGGDDAAEVRAKAHARGEPGGQVAGERGEVGGEGLGACRKGAGAGARQLLPRKGLERGPQDGSGSPGGRVGLLLLPDLLPLALARLPAAPVVAPRRAVALPGLLALAVPLPVWPGTAPAACAAGLRRRAAGRPLVTLGVTALASAPRHIGLLGACAGGVTALLNVLKVFLDLTKRGPAVNCRAHARTENSKRVC